MLGITSLCLAVERGRPTGVLLSGKYNTMWLLHFPSTCEVAVFGKSTECSARPGPPPHVRDAGRSGNSVGTGDSLTRRLGCCVRSAQRGSRQRSSLFRWIRWLNGYFPHLEFSCRIAHFCYSPEEAKNYAPRCKGDQRDAVAQGVNGLHQNIKRDLQRKKKRL